MTNSLTQHLFNQCARIPQYKHMLLKSGLTASLLVTFVVFSAGAFSAAPVLADKPLGKSSGTIKPNLMFVFDTSQSMNKKLANDTLDDAAQCKAAMKNRSGTAITSLTVGPTAGIPSRPNTRLAIQPSSGFSNGNLVYLAIPGKPEYSGVYKIKAKNTVAAGGCVPGTEVYTTTVGVNNPYKYNESNPVAVAPDKYNQTGYNPGNPLADPPVAPTNGCSVPAALPANSGNTTSDQNLGGGFVVDASGVTGTPSGSCYIRDRKDTNGCKVTTPATLANSGSTSNQNLGGGFVETAIGGVTTTSSSSCYWYDPADIPIGTFVSCTAASGSGENSLEVDIAVGAPAGALTGAEITDARIVIQSDESKCYFNEPPLVAAKVQSLFYDPSVEYVPPPKPTLVGLGTASPANRLPSMTSAYTSNWANVRIDGTRLNASGDPVTNANGTACNAAGTNLLTCNNTYKAPDGTFDFKKWEEMVYCDTPDRPASFVATVGPVKTAEQNWHESSRCQRNTPANTSSTTNSSPRYPYPYPSTTDGGAASPSKTNFHIVNAEYQNGKSKTGKNPVADLYAFGERYQFSNPFYYNVRAIEYCSTAKLNDCIMATAPSGAFTEPAYVRYCKTQVQATDTSTSPPASACQGVYTGTSASDYRFARYGLFERVDVIPTVTSYAKSADRTDCLAATCTYAEEMTNLANWYAYYSTRMQLIKSAVGRTFDTLDENYRVGLITVENYNTAGNYMPIKDFVTGTNFQKENWFKNLYSRWPAGGTSLRDVLGTVGRIYAGKKPVTGFTAISDDPVQYSCQKNYTLLTTDGYWNGPVGQKIDGSAVGNQDAAPTPRPQREGAAAIDSLADVAQYYFETDIRSPTNVPPNCTGSLGTDVCLDDVIATADDPKTSQHMTTYTLGLGVDGLLNSTNYKTATVGDFVDITSGAANWPVPGADNGDTTFTAAERATVDDLWHAAVNGHGTYFSARNPQQVITGIGGTLATLSDAIGTGSATSLSNNTPVAGDNYAYSARYVTGTWTGNLFARTIAGDGTLSLGAVWCVENEASVTPTCAPNASTGLGAKVGLNADTRTIYANVSGSLQSFKYANLTATQQAFFNTANIGGLSQWAEYNAYQLSQVGGATLVDYLRGQTQYDRRPTNNLNVPPATTGDNRLYRERTAVLGDIVDSDPVYVGESQTNYADAGYTAFKATTTTRDRMVYVGANDGMLHAFNATTGEERWAYVPTKVMPNMWKLADEDYRNKHTNFVNAKMTVADVYVGGAWKTILVSGFGQGGRGYFALDITNPSIAPILLWETDDSSTWDNLGYSYGKPVITKRAVDNKWVVLITSGYNNASPGDGGGRLFVLDANTGTELVTGGIFTGTGTSSAPSGLAQISAFVSSPFINNVSQYVYGGDLLGNVWRFNLNTNSMIKFTTLDSLGSPQPITVAPTLGEIDSNRVVFIGTGKYIEPDDLLSAGFTTQTLYGIKDNDVTSTITGLRATLVEQVLSGTSGTREVVTTNPVDWSSTNGWFVDLSNSATTGERQNVRGILASGALIIPTMTPPAGICGSGSGWLNVFDYRTGGAVDPFLSTVVSTQTTSLPAGIYTVYDVNNTTDGSLVVGIDFSDGKTGGGGVTPPTNGEFLGTRSIWRELIVP